MTGGEQHKTHRRSNNVQSADTGRLVTAELKELWIMVVFATGKTCYILDSFRVVVDVQTYTDSTKHEEHLLFL